MLNVSGYAQLDPARVSLSQSLKNLLVIVKGAPKAPGIRKIINSMTHYLFAEPFIDVIKLIIACSLVD